VDAVIEFLEAEQARGRTHVFLDDGARDGLRELFRRAAAGGGARPVRSVPVAEPVASAAAGPPRQAAVGLAADDGSAGTERIPSLSIEGTGKEQRLESLRKQAETWAPARSLGTLRETMVFATGDPDARIMLVGEAPGYEEERRREPFVGPAGQKLNDILRAMGLERGEVYISNIVKFRPATPRQATNNRPPSTDEIAACLPFIRAEVEIVKPACIVALGATAAKGLLGLDASVASMRGNWHTFGGVPVRVTYHPSYLLQSGATHQIKRQAWEDMMEVMMLLGMPISEKQRGFFLPKV
jgi:DNA polymerase